MARDKFLRRVLNDKYLNFKKATMSEFNLFLVSKLYKHDPV